MNRILLLFLTVLCAVHGLRVMTFNIWSSGSRVHDGTDKIVHQIREKSPDIVALQEAHLSHVIGEIVAKLNKYESNWVAVTRCEEGRLVPGTKQNAVLTRHHIIGYEHTVVGVNARIKLRNTGQEISVWSMHLQWTHFGPDAVLRGETIEQLLSGEINGDPSRIDNIVELFRTPSFVQQIKNSNNVPVIMAGDFNTPSDLDWIESTKDSHKGYVVEWPVTKLLREAAGMTDSYREVYPNPKTNPGITWPVYNYDKDSGLDALEDRIDFIFYRGPLRAVASRTYKGDDPLKLGRDDSDWIENKYPSDHYALITDFEHVDNKYEKEPTFAHRYAVKGELLKKTCPLEIIS